MPACSYSTFVLVGFLNGKNNSDDNKIKAYGSFDTLIEKVPLAAEVNS